MIETPAIEQVDTFVHGIGESTDVVRKEMFRVVSGALFGDLLEAGTEAGLKPRQRMAMRPEGTAGVVRAAVENNLVPQGAAPAKLWYAEAMFRGERPQKGRLRQFHQVGVEWLGASDPASDAECIIMLMEFFKRLGFDPSKLHLYINSMGDGECRPAYRDKVRAFILDHRDEMCEDCLERAEINPLRAFDCKNPHCHEVMAGAPLVNDHLCGDCAEHYAAVKRYLDEAGVSYTEDPTLTRTAMRSWPPSAPLIDHLCARLHDCHTTPRSSGTPRFGVSLHRDPRSCAALTTTPARSLARCGGRHRRRWPLRRPDGARGRKAHPGHRLCRGLRAHRAGAGLPGRGACHAGPPASTLPAPGAGERDAVFAATLALRQAGSAPRPTTRAAAVPVQTGRQTARDALRRARARRGRRRASPPFATWPPTAGAGAHGRPCR